MLLMKVVFNSSRPLSPQQGRALLRVLCVWGALLLNVVIPPSQAWAQTAYFTPRTILAEFFPRSQAVTFERFDLTADQQKRLTDLLGYTPRKASYTIYVAKTAEQVDGYAIIDEEKGQHLPITFAVKFDAKGTVTRQEIMVYRERYGDEIRDARFRQQFVGKHSRSQMREGEEIIAISGATISSRSIVIGVRRALVLLDELVLKRPQNQPGGTPQRSMPSS